MKVTHQVLAIFDKKTGAFTVPFICRHPGEALREFELLRSKTETKYGQHPNDFALIHIASYDEDLGTYENLESHVTIGN